MKKWSNPYPFHRRLRKHAYQNRVVSNFSMKSWIRLPGVRGGKSSWNYALDNDLTLKAAALKLGFVSEAAFDRVVDPAKMVHLC